MNQYQIKHTGGVGAFFYAGIPALIAGALLMYFAFYVGIIDWQKTQRIEARMDNRVGVNGQLTAPVDLIIRDSPKRCLRIDRAFLDSGNLTMYLKSTCTDRLRYWEVHWNSISPDGTTISNGYTNHTGTYGGTGIDAGETLELHEELSSDTRTAKVVLWSRDND